MVSSFSFATLAKVKETQLHFQNLQATCLTLPFISKKFGYKLSCAQ